jgi:hypothetical protein
MTTDILVALNVKLIQTLYEISDGLHLKPEN